MARVRSMAPAFVAVAVLAAAALAGCGASPATRAGAPSPPAMRLSTGDMGRTVTAQHGTTVEVSLPAVNGFEPWSTPSADDASVLARGSSPAPAPSGTTTATFKAAGDGTTRITAHAKVACSASPGVACPMVVRSWSVTVKVTG